MFGGELLSQEYIQGTDDILSAITIQALADIGWQVDVTRADAYDLPAADAGRGESDSDAQHAKRSPPPRAQQDPIYVADAKGRVVRIVVPPR